MIKVLFVCLGNICRSPLAEAILINKVQQRGKSDFIKADSCGTSNYNIGLPPDARTMANAAENGITVKHMARQLSRKDFDAFDLILAMDKSNLKNILGLSPSKDQLQKIHLMREFDPLGTGDVPDPYYGGKNDFQEVFDILDRSINHLLTTNLFLH